MPGLTLAQMFWIAYRRRWWILLPAALGLAAGIAAGELTSPAYRASTLIMVETQRVPNDYVKATVTTSLQDRLKSIEQQVINRENLVELIEALNLYPESRTEGSMVGAVERARGDITIQLLGQTTFRIWYRGSSREVVAPAANRIAEQFIRDTLGARERQARTTSNFLETELESMRARLQEQELRIAEFKRLHLGQLPEQRESILRAIEQLQARLRMNLDDSDKTELKMLILERGSQAGGSAGSEMDLPRRLQQLRQELTELRARYTDLHPDVVRTEAAIRNLETEIATAAAAVPPAATVEGPTSGDEIAALAEEERLRRTERQRIYAEIGALQARLERIPGVEQELQALTRDYTNVENSYRSLVTKGIEARLAENLEKRRQDEQFTILETAETPENPYYPDPFLFAAVGLLIGGAAGAGLAVLREQFDQTYTTVDGVRRDFPAVPILATIPVLGKEVMFGRGYYPESEPERRT